MRLFIDFVQIHKILRYFMITFVWILSFMQHFENVELVTKPIILLLPFRLRLFTYPNFRQAAKAHYRFLLLHALYLRYQLQQLLRHGLECRQLHVDLAVVFDYCLLAVFYVFERRF